MATRATQRHTRCAQPACLFFVGDHAREAKVNDLYYYLAWVLHPFFCPLCEPYILWLQISVQHIPRMDVLHALQNLLDHLQAPGEYRDAAQATFISRHCSNREGESQKPYFAWKLPGDPLTQQTRPIDERSMKLRNKKGSDSSAGSCTWPCFALVQAHRLLHSLHACMEIRMHLLRCCLLACMCICCFQITFKEPFRDHHASLCIQDLSPTAHHACF
jgi:hypothetical protein